MESTEKIIGEAAYRILLRQQKVTVAQLQLELKSMASEEESGLRQNSITYALAWLQNYRQPSSAEQPSHSPLRGLHSDDFAIRVSHRDRGKK